MYKELLEYIIKNLVTNPDSVVVTQTQTEEKLLLKVKVEKSDMGRVIGKEGRIIRSIREIINAYAQKNHEKVSIDIDEIKDVKE